MAKTTRTRKQPKKPVLVNYYPEQLDETNWVRSASGIYHLAITTARSSVISEIGFRPLCRPGAPIKAAAYIVGGVAPCLTDDQMRLRHKRGTIKVCPNCLARRRRPGFFTENAQANGRIAAQSGR